MQPVGPLVGVDSEVVQAAGEDLVRLLVEKESLVGDLKRGHGWLLLGARMVRGGGRGGAREAAHRPGWAGLSRWSR